MKVKVIHRLLLFCGILPFFLSCTEEKVGGCPNLSVHLEYMGDGTTNVLRKYIASITYYVYDSNGNYVSEGYWPVGENSGDLLKRSLRLEQAGTYRIVCWGNLEHYSKAVNTQRLEDACVCPRTMGGETAYASCDPLYFGETEVEIADVEGEATATVRFHSAHITLWMYVKGVEDIGEDGRNLPPQFCVAECQGECDFRGKEHGQPVDFIPESVYDEEERVFMARCHVSRFDENAAGVIEVYRTTGHHLLEAVELKQFIAENGIVLTGREEVDIPILLEFNGMDVIITMPEWDIEESKPVL